jgi:hypothetical protein
MVCARIGIMMYVCQQDMMDGLGVVYVSDESTDIVSLGKKSFGKRMFYTCLVLRC